MASDNQISTIISKFELQRVLYEDPRSKLCNALGVCHIDDNEVPALLLMEKTHYTPALYETLRQGIASTFPRIEVIGQNDIYVWLFGWEQEEACREANTKMTLICPASDELIAKYSAPQRRMLIESPHMYKAVTKPWIDSIPTSKTTWVHNIPVSYTHLTLPTKA